VAVNEIAGIGSEGVSLLESFALNAEWEQPDELVLLSGDGHWWIALDYRERGREAEPPVVFYENGSDGAPDDLRLADSFREFVCPGENNSRPVAAAALDEPSVCR